MNERSLDFALRRSARDDRLDMASFAPGTSHAVRRAQSRGDFRHVARDFNPGRGRLWISSPELNPAPEIVVYVHAGDRCSKPLLSILRCHESVACCCTPAL